MTPYVQLQERVINILRKLLKANEDDYITALLTWCKNERNTDGLNLSDADRFHTFDIYFPALQGDMTDNEWAWIRKTAAEIVVQQLDTTTEPSTVRNLLGTPLYSRQPLGYRGYIAGLGSGNNRLRKDERFAQPATLLEGDILANGDRVLSEPREGGNGSVLIHLTGGYYGHWIGVPARMPIALLHPDDGAPPELVEKWQPRED